MRAEISLDAAAVACPADNGSMVRGPASPLPRLDHALLDRHPLAVKAGIRDCTLRRFSAGELILEEGEPCETVLLLLRGSVRATVSAEDGREAMTRLIGAPAELGLLEALSGTRCVANLRAMEPTTVGSIAVEAWRALMSACPGLGRAVFEAIARDQAATVACQRRALFGKVDQRLASLLLEYLDLYGLPVATGKKIRLRLRYEDLADALGVACRSVTRAICAWRSQGWIDQERGYFVVRDRRALVRQCASLATIVQADRASRPATLLNGSIANIVA